MFMTDLGLIIEFSKWKEKFQEEDEQEYLSKLVMICKELDQRVDSMGLFGKGVYRELSRFSLTNFNNKLDIC